MYSQNTHNLIGFLAKKSLFRSDNKNKQKNITQINSQTDPFSRSITPKSRLQLKSTISQINVFKDPNQQQLYRKGVSEIQKLSPGNKKINMNNNIKQQNNIRQQPNIKNIRSQINNRFDKQQVNRFDKEQIDRLNKQQKNRFDKIKGDDIYYSHVKQYQNKYQDDNPQTIGKQIFYKSTNNYKSNKSNNTNQSNNNNNNSNNINMNNNNPNNLFTGFRQQKQSHNKITTTKLTQHQSTKAFDSLQTQSQQCLQQLSNKLYQQINQLNYTIQSFNSKIFKLLHSQLQSIKNKIYIMIQDIFKQTQNKIHLFIKQQQSSILNQIFNTKHILETQLHQINQMKINIKTNQWRKITASIIASDLSNNIQELIIQSSLLTIKSPELKSQPQSNKLNQINNQLKQIFNIDKWQFI